MKSVTYCDPIIIRESSMSFLFLALAFLAGFFSHNPLVNFKNVIEADILAEEAKFKADISSNVSSVKSDVETKL